MKNYYKTLGISQNCTKDEIRKAFRELAFKYHPDKNRDEKFSEHFKEINEAKQVLLDDLKKFQYDVSLAHFSSQTTIFPGVKYRRKKSYKRNIAFQMIKETATNKFFVGFLLTITILLTIAFLKIPAEDPVLYSTIPKNSEGRIEKDPLAAKPVIATSYLADQEAKKQSLINTIKKEPLKIKAVTPAVYWTNKKVKKHASIRKPKKPKSYGRIKIHRPKTKAATSFASAAHVDKKGFDGTKSPENDRNFKPDKSRKRKNGKQ